MTLPRRDVTELTELTEMPAASAAVGQQLLPERNRYRVRVIGDDVADVRDDAHFAALSDTTGRAALAPAPALLALVTLFQCMENIPDREAAEQVVVRRDWTYA
jgi:transposase